MSYLKLTDPGKDMDVKYRHASVTGPASVLAVTRDTAFLRAARLEMPLFNLRKQGIIDDYFITDPSLFDVPDDFAFDVVWLQRVNDPRLIEHLGTRIHNHFLYDLDDFLIGRALYRPDELMNKEAVLEAVKNCRVLVVTSKRLAKLLQKFLAVDIQSKIVVCPNAFEFPNQIRTPRPPQGVILTSTEPIALTESRDSVFRAVDAFSERHELPVYYFGPTDHATIGGLGRLVPCGFMPYWHYHAILAAFPPMIGIAALETKADRDTLDFISGKSDVKMMEFGGFGHPSVYSKAPPYIDTDLEVGIVVENSTEAWSAALEAIYGELWKRLASDQKQVMVLRNMDKVAADCWDKAVKEARLPHPMTGKEIKYSSGKIHFFLNAAKHMVLSQDFYFKRKVAEQIPAPVRRLLRKLFLQT
jgi:hypothetical protein